jgi:hypothetical protein
LGLKKFGCSDFINHWEITKTSSSLARLLENVKDTETQRALGNPIGAFDLGFVDGHGKYARAILRVFEVARYGIKNLFWIKRKM